jgi:hypothetical protein
LRPYRAFSEAGESRGERRIVVASVAYSVVSRSAHDDSGAIVTALYSRP